MSSPPPESLSVALTASPCSFAIICSTGPPGAIWMIMKLTVIIPIRVGTTSSKRRIIYAVIKINAEVYQSSNLSDLIQILLFFKHSVLFFRIHPPGEKAIIAGEIEPVVFDFDKATAH
jgi:hypothetical protein